MCTWPEPEGTPWRSLRATADKASGSTLRRYLERWAQIGLLAQVHAALIGMLRGDPTLILDSGSTLRRYLEWWAQIGLLAQVHAALIGMLRGDPTLILDSGLALHADKQSDPAQKTCNK